LSTAKSQKARIGKVTAKAIKEVATNIDKRIVRMRKPASVPGETKLTKFAY